MAPDQRGAFLRWVHGRADRLDRSARGQGTSTGTSGRPRPHHRPRPDEWRADRVVYLRRVRDAHGHHSGGRAVVNSRHCRAALITELVFAMAVLATALI